MSITKPNKKPAQIIKYDFKNKRKVLDYKTDRWMCSTCGSHHLYDSRSEHNEKRLTVVVKVDRSGSVPISICTMCLMEMNSAMFGDED